MWLKKSYNSEFNTDIDATKLTCIGECGLKSLIISVDTDSLFCIDFVFEYFYIYIYVLIFWVKLIVGNYLICVGYYMWYVCYLFCFLQNCL